MLRNLLSAMTLTPGVIRDIGGGEGMEFDFCDLDVMIKIFSVFMGIYKSLML